ncbi:diphosphomevalonate decarboxylase-like [Watersipora subatra]|uniref:diphosphomevalonate decarboxylase-like n=1 Tax=Watersipora subatra TaxID=2589382 RepID=UPI00355AD98C
MVVEKICVTCTAPVNIAVIKYWGKRDEELVLPENSSLSVTLSQDQLCAKTTVMVNPQFKADRMWLNGREEVINKRLSNVIKEVKRLAEQKFTSDNHILDFHLHICSENNFPTAAGLASSAAGLACLAMALCKVYGVTDKDSISRVARVGSGSACRSVYGGFVAWRMGKLSDGSDSIAEQVAPQSHWPQLKCLILVVSADKKAVGSTAGMQNSVSTSSLFKHRAQSVVPERMEVMERAIAEKDFETFAKITMQDSNQLHAICLDTYPPIFYMNDVSRRIVLFVNEYNDYKGSLKVAYTFDAGPNACLYLLDDCVEEVASLVRYYFPPTDGELTVKGIPLKHQLNQEFVEGSKICPSIASLAYMISTEVGSDPRVLDNSESLLANDGMPISIS